MLDNKDKLFTVFRDFASQLFGDFAFPKTELALKSVKLVGVELDTVRTFSDNDHSFLQQMISALYLMRIPLSKDFTGTFDSLRETDLYEPSDFLKVDEEVDVLSIHYVVGVLGTERSRSFRGAVMINEISENHLQENAWRDAVARHKPKVIFTYGGDMEISAKDLITDEYVEYSGPTSQGICSSILISKSYIQMLQRAGIDLDSTLKPFSTFKNGPLHPIAA